MNYTGSERSSVTLAPKLSGSPLDGTNWPYQKGRLRNTLDKSEKHVLGAPQRAVGKSISEDDNRWMMDLIDVSPEAIPAGYWKFFLVAVNVFDRYMYARPLPGKDPKEVAAKLREILDEGASEGRKRPQFISSDNGAEFGGAATQLL